MWYKLYNKHDKDMENIFLLIRRVALYKIKVKIKEISDQGKSKKMWFCIRSVHKTGWDNCKKAVKYYKFLEGDATCTNTWKAEGKAKAVDRSVQSQTKLSLLSFTLCYLGSSILEFLL